MLGIVTGADRGLGLEILKEMDRRNWDARGTTVKELDLSRENSIVRYVEEIKKEERPIGCLINNAGVNQICKFREQSLEQMEWMMRVNCLGPIMLIQRLLNAGKLNGSVCNVISDASWKPMRHSLAYNMSKAAMAMATRQMARELTKQYPHLTVFGVNPGKMSGTHMSEYIDEQVMELRGWTAEGAKEYYQASAVNGRESEPRQVAWHIVNLVEGSSNQFLSGAVVDLVG
jgi:NAD(P)-dependent dehydrogenase (short-subunit alcohol dehydrogenase family)